MFNRSFNILSKIFSKISVDKNSKFISYRIKPLLMHKRSLSIAVQKSTNLPAVQDMDKIIGIGQMCATNNKASNRKQVEEIVRSAVKQKVCFLFLPECCDFVGTNREETATLSEPLTGDTVSFYKDLARNNNIWLSIGGIHETILVDEKPTSRINNTHVIINNEGELAGIYRKLHLFDVETPEFKFHESATVDGGDCVVSPVFDTPIGGGIGLMICYDVRFPELSTILRRRGAKFLLYPSAFSYSTGMAHWEILLRARAVENQCFVIAPAQVGFHNEKRQSWGHGMVVDPWGKILVECENDDPSKPICKAVALDLTEIDLIRQRLPCFDHRRDEVYALAALQMKLPVQTIPESKLRKRAKTILTIQSEDQQEQIPEEEEPYFLFEKHPVYKSTIFYETASSLAFTNITCVVPGHILVVTRRRVDRLKELNPEEIVDFFLTVCKCQRLLEEYYQTTSATVTVQDGENAGQTVKHVHCHIMPRKLGDFEHNDQIYIELNRHDHPEEVPDTPNVVKRRMRSIEERSKEAEDYRKHFKNFKFLKSI